MDSIYTTNCAILIGSRKSLDNYKTCSTQRETEGSNRASDGSRNPQTTVPVLIAKLGEPICEQQLKLEGVLHIITINGI